MSQRQRAGLLVACVVLIGLAFIALRPDDEEPERTASPPATAVTPPPASTGTTEPAPAPPPPPPRPSYVEIRAKGLKPVGGVKRISVKKGETVRIEVRSDQPEEAHLHGYDISRPVGPGKRGRFVFKARLDGIYELELEHAAVEIAQLRVNP